MQRYTMRWMTFDVTSPVHAHVVDDSAPPPLVDELTEADLRQLLCARFILARLNVLDGELQHPWPGPNRSCMAFKEKPTLENIC